MQQDPTITTPDNPGSPAASTAEVIETLRSCANIASGMEAGTIMAHEIDWHKLAARCSAAVESLLVPATVRTDAPVPSVMRGTIDDMDTKLPLWESEGPEISVVSAARELARGGEARFARVELSGHEWKLLNVVRFASTPSEIRLHRADGNPLIPIGLTDSGSDSGSAILHAFEPGHRIGSSPTAIARDTGIIATKLQRYLTQYGASYVRLRLDGRRLS